MVVQWLISRLPMQGTQVQSLIREDPTRCGATTTEAPEKPLPGEACSPQLEKAHERRQRPSAVKNEWLRKKLTIYNNTLDGTHRRSVTENRQMLSFKEPLFICARNVQDEEFHQKTRIGKKNQTLER